MSELTLGQQPFLRVLDDASKPLTAREIADVLYDKTTTITAPARSASASSNMRELIRKGFAERKLKGRELYAYTITDAGRAAFAKWDGR